MFSMLQVIVALNMQYTFLFHHLSSYVLVVAGLKRNPPPVEPFVPGIYRYSKLWRRLWVVQR